MAGSNAFFGQVAATAGSNPFSAVAPQSSIFNLGNPLLSMAANMAAEPLFASLGVEPGKLFPSQSVYDQRMARAYRKASEKISSEAAAVDAINFRQHGRGMIKMFTGGAPTVEQEEFISRVSGFAGQAMPMLAGFAPDFAEQIMGKRGSATVAAGIYQRAGQLDIDPVTGAAGLSPESAAYLSTSMSRRYFGADTDVTPWKGFGQGKVASLYEEMRLRGLTPSGVSASDMTQRVAALQTPEGLKAFAMSDPDTFKSLVSRVNTRRTARGQDAVGDTPEAMSAQTDSRELADALSSFEASDPTAQKIMRSVATGRVGESLKEMTKAVAAVRDLFGANGRPDAPMKELVAGLEMLTQNGMTGGASADQLAREIGMLHVAGKNIGMGLDAQGALSAQVAGIIDQNGGDRRNVARISAQTMTFASAFRDVGVQNTWGGLSLTEATAVDAKLRTQASTAGITNLLGAAARVSDRMSAAGIKPTGELASLMAALKDPDASRGMFINAAGKQESMLMTRDRMSRILASAGISEAERNTLMSQTEANKEYSSKYDIGGDVTRRFLQVEDMRSKVAEQSRGAAFTRLGNVGGLTERQRDALAGQLSNAAANSLLGMTSAQLSNSETRTKMMAESANAVLDKSGLSAAQKAAITRQGGLANMADAMYGDLTDYANRHGSRNATSMLQPFTVDVRSLSDKRQIAAAAEVNARQLLSSLGTSGPIARLADVIREPTASLPVDIGRVLGGIKAEDVLAANGTADQLHKLDSKSRAAILVQGTRDSLAASQQALQLPEDQRKAAMADADAHTKALIEGKAAATSRQEQILNKYGIKLADSAGVIAGWRTGVKDTDVKMLRELEAAKVAGLNESAKVTGLSGDLTAAEVEAADANKRKADMESNTKSFKALKGNTKFYTNEHLGTGATGVNARSISIGMGGIGAMADASKWIAAGTNMDVNAATEAKRIEQEQSRLPTEIKGTVTLVDDRTAEVNLRPVSSDTTPT